MKCIWLTDIHLNFLDENERKNFYQNIIDAQADAILLTGDIAEAPSLPDILNEMTAFIQKPIYFILGNHDYYRGQVNEVRMAMVILTEAQKGLFWLPASGIQQLNDDVILIGQDGWADGRLGDYPNSSVVLNDSRLITDLFQKKILGKYALLEKMQELADSDALKLKDNLMQAITQNPKKIIVLTHVPPFKENCLYNSKISEDDYLPFFGSKIMGDVLTQVAEENKHIEFLVLCGHTHSESHYQPLDNLLVRSGKADYGHPEIQCLILEE